MPALTDLGALDMPDTLIRKVFDTIFGPHVNVEPTVRVQAVWGSRSKTVDDNENLIGYWNRTDTDVLHGASSEISI